MFDTAAEAEHERVLTRMIDAPRRNHEGWRACADQFSVPPRAL